MLILFSPHFKFTQISKKICAAGDLITWSPEFDPLNSLQTPNCSPTQLKVCSPMLEAFWKIKNDSFFCQGAVRPYKNVANLTRKINSRIFLR